MRHIGQELRFVFGCERQLLGFFFKRAAGLFHFFVLGFHFILLFYEQQRLILQLIVRSSQLFLLDLQLTGQRLRLGQQLFGPRSWLRWY